MRPIYQVCDPNKRVLDLIEHVLDLINKYAIPKHMIRIRITCPKQLVYKTLTSLSRVFRLATCFIGVG